MRKLIVVSLVVAWMWPGLASAQQPPRGCVGINVQSTTFQVCEGIFALCTTAPCTWVDPNNTSAGLRCDCTVNSGYSAGSTVYDPPDQVGPGSRIASRYFPITNYQVCTATPTADQPWAWCLDAPCTVSSNPALATCTCDAVTGATYDKQPTTPWIVVATQYTPQHCTTPTWSSATIAQMQSATVAMNQYNQRYRIPNMFQPTPINPP